MMGVMDAFSTSYTQARVKFLEAAATAGLQFESFNAPPMGKDGAVMALDVAVQKPANNKVEENLLIISSVAKQSADGIAGSGVQVFMLHDAEWLVKVRTAGIRVLYLHGAEHSLPEVVKKQVKHAKKVFLLDLSAANTLKTAVFQALVDAQLSEKCTFTVVKTMAPSEPVWQGQTISLARQALFKAVDSFSNH